MARRACLAILTLALLALAVTTSAAKGKGVGRPQRVNSDNIYNVLGGNARKEFDKLSEQARYTALTSLDEHVITVADEDELHFNERGNLYFADRFVPPDSDKELGLAEDVAGSSRGNGTRRRRAVSDKPPDYITSNGLPIMHSKPGSPNVIYLDFDGDSRSSSVWGSFYNEGYNPRGDPGDFDSVERSEIIQAWARAAEDFSPFEVDVTTEQPSSWTQRTLHCVIASSHMPNGYEMPAAYAGGVAMVDVFNYYDTRYMSPCFVYWDNLNWGRNDYVGECISHEVGHNLGLSHDGRWGSTYYSGDDNPDDPVSWAPIMGSGYLNSVTQWSNGHYDGATNLEDDIAILDRNLGRRKDDAGNTRGSAVKVDYTSKDFSSFKATGIIETDTDHDWWRVVVYGTGQLSVNADPWEAPSRTLGGNLDIRMRLRKDNKKVLKTAQPWDQTKASATVDVTPGTYYIDIAGDDDPYNYPAYASLGQYDITGAAPGISPGELSEDKGCSCRKQNGQTTTKTRRRFRGKGVIEFCIKNKNGNGRVWAKVRVKPDGVTRWSKRAITKKLWKQGQTLCAFYRPQAGEESYKHELRLKKEQSSTDGILRF